MAAELHSEIAARCALGIETVKAAAEVNSISQVSLYQAVSRMKQYIEEYNDELEFEAPAMASIPCVRAVAIYASMRKGDAAKGIAYDMAVAAHKEHTRALVKKLIAEIGGVE